MTLLPLVISFPVLAQYVTAIKVKNEVRVCSPASTCRKVAFGQRVLQGDTVTTGEDAYAQLRFPTGSTITVAPNSRMVIDSAQQNDKKVKTDWGKFNFEIKARDKKSKFKVQTPVVTAGAEGTSFSVSVEQGTGLTRIELTDGTLRITSLLADRKSIVMQPGHCISVQRDAPMPEPALLENAPSGGASQPSGNGQAEDAPANGSGSSTDETAPKTQPPPEATPEQTQPLESRVNVPGASDRLMETVQSASGGFVAQQSEVGPQAEIPPPTVVKKKSPIIIHITE